MSEEPLPEMSFLDHLEELRTRLLRVTAGLAVIFLILYTALKDQLVELVLLPLAPFGLRLVSLTPAEAFLNNLKVSVYAAILVCSPHWFLELWMFVAPGLYRKEKKSALPCLAGMVIMFFTGIIFCFKYVLPLAINFFISEHGRLLIPTWSYEFYIGFSLKLFLAFGLAFELPWLMYFLAKIGLVTSRQLLGWFNYAVVIIFIVAAVLTPPDVVSQILLAIPLIILYFIGVFLAKVAE